MMPKLYRQIGRELYAIFFATLLILVSIILSFRLAGLLHHASQGQLSLAAILPLLGLQALRFLALLAPLAFILAAMMTLGRMQRDLEITAMEAAGLPWTTLLQALLLALLPLWLLLALWHYYGQAEVYRQQEWLQKQAQQEAAMLLFTPHSFRVLSDGSVVHTEAIEAQQLRQFFLWRPEQNGFSVLHAEQGYFSQEQGRRLFHLQAGQRLALEKHHLDYARFESASLLLPLPQISASDRLRNVPTAQLNHSPAHRGEWQARFNPLVALLIFTLFLPPLARSPVRSGRYQKLLPTFVLFALYSNGLDVLVLLIKKEQLAPFPGSASLHGLVLLLGLLYLRRQTGRPPRV